MLVSGDLESAVDLNQSFQLVRITRFDGRNVNWLGFLQYLDTDTPIGYALCADHPRGEMILTEVNNGLAFQIQKSELEFEKLGYILAEMPRDNYFGPQRPQYGIKKIRIPCIPIEKVTPDTCSKGNNMRKIIRMILTPVWNYSSRIQISFESDLQSAI